MSVKNVVEIIKEYNGNCRKLKFLEVDTEDKIRFNVVTDSIASHSLLGGGGNRFNPGNIIV